MESQLTQSFEPVFQDRRATSHFGDTPVPVSALAKILNAGHMACSGHNHLQPARFLLLRSAERKEALRRAAFGQENITEAPIVIVAYAPHNAWNETGEARLSRQVMAAFTHLKLAAESLGWDTTPITGFDAAAVRKELGLEEDVQIVALLAIGRLTDEVPAFPGRMPLSRVFLDEPAGRGWQGN